MAQLEGDAGWSDACGSGCRNPGLSGVSFQHGSELLCRAAGNQLQFQLHPLFASPRGCVAAGQTLSHALRRRPGRRPLNAAGASRTDAG